MTTAGLPEFLLARVDEDEQVARACIPTLNRSEGGWHATDMQVRDDCDHLVVKHSWPNEIDHITRWDPARALAECRVKRALLEIHRRNPGRDAINPDHCEGCGYQGDIDWPITERIDNCPELQILALLYEHHPAYRPEWRSYAI